MQTRHLIILASVAALLSACIPSLHPFYTEKDVVFDHRLLGVWQKGEKPEALETWNFTEDGDKTYALTIKDKDQGEGRFTVRLFKLGKENFLDFVPKEYNLATNQTDLVKMLLFPGHLLARADQLQPDLKLSFFDFEWLQKHLEAHADALAVHREGDKMILTAQTLELQNFVLQNMDKLFQESSTFVRMTNQVPDNKK